MIDKLKSLLQKIQKKLPKIRLPSLKKLEETVQELVTLGGFIMVFIGL